MGLEGLLDLPLKHAEGLTDSGEILISLANPSDESKELPFQDFVLDWEIYFHLCKVYCFQNLEGLKKITKKGVH